MVIKLRCYFVCLMISLSKYIIIVAVFLLLASPYENVIDGMFADFVQLIIFGS